MSNPVILFKANDPKPLEAWYAENEIKLEKYNAEVDAFAQSLGVKNMCERRINFGRGTKLTGYVEEDWTVAPKEGFRRDPDTRFMVPALRTKAG